MTYKYKIPTLLFIIFTISLLQISCKKLVEIDAPTTSISGKNVYTDNSTAASVLTGMYTVMSRTNGLTGADLVSIGFLTGLSSDELTLYSGSSDVRLNSYYKNNIVATGMGANLWATIYPQLFVANSAIEGISSSTTLSTIVQKQLLGEAKFMRAFLFFYLVNLYGDVPLVLSTDFTKNEIQSRSPKNKVWEQIIADLTEAKSLLSEKYLDGSIQSETAERVRPNRWVATALLARSYLYTHDWQKAIDQSSEIINHTTLYNLDSLDNVFLSNSQEALWQLQPVIRGSNTEDAKTYIIRPTGPAPQNPAYLSNELITSFEKNDMRKNKWVDTVTSASTLYYFPYKYKSAKTGAPVTEYHTILRLSEQYLIRAEARANLNDMQGSMDDLNIIRKRAWLNNFKSQNKSSLLHAIYHERQVELFTEWGHRWLDLKRTETIDSVMNIVTPIKGGTWSKNWSLYPIPPSDILFDGNLTQNEGY